LIGLVGMGKLHDWVGYSVLVWVIVEAYLFLSGMLSVSTVYDGMDFGGWEGR
jgi:hypothetical protein